MASATSSEGPQRAALRRAQAQGPGALAGLTLLAAIIRVPTLATQSFWLDEAYTERLVRMTFGGMLHGIGQTESTPPVYYAVAWVWTRVCTSSEFGLRSLSALAGIATVPVVYATADRLAGRRAGLIAAGLVATSPLMVWFSQEARAYALATLLASVTLMCLVAHLQAHRRGWLAGWAISAALGLATHYFVAFVVAPEAILLLGAVRRERSAGREPPTRALSGALGLVACVAVVLVPLALAQRGTGHADYIAQGSLSTRVAQVPKQLLIGYASPGQLATGLAAALLLVLGAGPALVASRDARARALPAVAVGVAAVIAPIVLALLGVDFLNTRNLLVALPPLTVAAAIGFAAATPWRFGGAAAGLLALIGLLVVILVDTNDRYQRDDWRGVSRALGPPAGARAIVASPGSGLIALEAYQPRLSMLLAPIAVNELDVVAIAPQVTGGGIGTPPRPATSLPAPAGFTAVATIERPTYTVVRYRARAPTVVGPSVGVADRLGQSGYTAILQTR